MELVSEMDTPQKAPLMRELVKGLSITIETRNNSKKVYTHSAMLEPTICNVAKC
jgi:hypothetical protein